MPRSLPTPVTVNDIFMAAVVEVLDEAVAILQEIRDRLPGVGQAAPVAPAEDTLGGSAGTDPPEGGDAVATSEIADPATVGDAVLVTEPAPVKAAKPGPKKSAPKPVKES